MNNLRHSETALKQAAVIRSMIDDLERNSRSCISTFAPRRSAFASSIKLTGSTRSWQDRSGPIATILKRRLPISNSVSLGSSRKRKCWLADKDLAHGQRAALPKSGGRMPSLNQKGEGRSRASEFSGTLLKAGQDLRARSTDTMRPCANKAARSESKAASVGRRRPLSF